MSFPYGLQLFYSFHVSAFRRFMEFYFRGGTCYQNPFPDQEVNGSSHRFRIPDKKPENTLKKTNAVHPLFAAHPGKYYPPPLNRSYASFIRFCAVK